MNADKLLPGDRLWTDAGREAEVVSRTVERSPLKAYNLHVSDFHTFFVRGADNDNAPAVWVHNAGECSVKLAAAQKKYPNKAGKLEKHHVDPKYMGGDKNGKLVTIDAAYHQEITNAFRALHPFGSGKIPSSQRSRIIKKVNDEFPVD